MLTGKMPFFYFDMSKSYHLAYLFFDWHETFVMLSAYKLKKSCRAEVVMLDSLLRGIVQNWKGTSALDMKLEA